ncbi:MAG TPA: hypothetical protein VL358_09180 [Caulobacteraceae bacterium]|jgi:hypothetical protein|nr:hypothetical protein [Caulobacteraceae bacterium]
MPIDHLLDDPPAVAAPRAAVAIRAARAKLNAPPRIAPLWPLLAAAAFAAFTALLLATAVIIGLPKF